MRLLILCAHPHHDTSVDLPIRNALRESKLWRGTAITFFYSTMLAMGHPLPVRESRRPGEVVSLSSPFWVQLYSTINTGCCDGVGGARGATSIARYFMGKHGFRPPF